MNTEALEELNEHKFAPGPLIAVQGFVNTYSLEDDEELMGDPASATEWLVGSGLLRRGARVGPGEHRELLGLRGLLRDLLESNLTGKADTQATKRFGQVARRHSVKFAVDEGGRVDLNLDPAESVEELIGQLLGIISRAQTLDQWRRLKICADDGCRWAFYDSSKNRGGTWCRMEVCGNRTKNRRYREKEA